MPHSYQKQLLSELSLSYPGICLHCVGSSYTKEYTYQQLRQCKDVQLGSYVTNNYSSYASVSDILTHWQWTSLNNWRESLKIIMLYKVIQQLASWYSKL